jgi:hypothetical protein
MQRTFSESSLLPAISIQCIEKLNKFRIFLKAVHYTGSFFHRRTKHEGFTHRKSAVAKIYRDGLTAVFKVSINESQCIFKNSVS